MRVSLSSPRDVDVAICLLEPPLPPHTPRAARFSLFSMLAPRGAAYAQRMRAEERACLRCCRITLA